jgi:predicted acylesterase/phospholipase RssA
MPIKHLVISGGGHSIFRTIGALNHLERDSFWHSRDILSIYGTSAGAIYGAIICLKFDHSTIENYLLNRPWHEAFHIKVDQLLNAYAKKGVFDHTAIDIIFKPLLNAIGLPLSITMQSLYDFSNIELHVFTLEINKFEIVDISYKTHPELLLSSALAMSCAIPGIFSPFCDDTGCYIDGGLIANYPLNYCIDAGADPDEILGLKFCFKNEENEENSLSKEENNGPVINKDSNLLDFFLGLFGKLVRKVGTSNEQSDINHELVCNATCMSYETLTSALSSVENRKQLFDEGVASATDFLGLQHSIQKLNKIVL